jgi:hypothetical protein
MDERQIPWQQLVNSVRMTWCLSVCGVALTYSFLWPMNVTPFLDARLALGSASSLGLCLGLAQFITFFPFCFVFYGSHFLVFFASSLHRHELLCYAGAMVKAIEGDGAASDVVPSLKKLELMMTARLRHGSRTWVRFTVYEVLCSGAWVLISAMFLVSRSDSGMWLARLVLASTIIVVLLAPLAAVSETFEYDVLKALNNPSILKGAQKYFGQQLLAHLNSLDWGFRVGGVVIGQRFLAQITTPLLIGILTAVSSTLQSNFESAVF